MHTLKKIRDEEIVEYAEFYYRSSCFQCRICTTNFAFAVRVYCTVGRDYECDEGCVWYIILLPVDLGDFNGHQIRWHQYGQEDI